MKNIYDKYLFSSRIVLQFLYLDKNYLGKNQESSCQTVAKFSTAFSFCNLHMGRPHADIMHTDIMPQTAEKINFDRPVLTIEGLQARFETIPLSNSLARLLGSNDLALIVQQLHYWLQQGYGVVIDGFRWIHKTIREMLEEVFPTLSYWKLSQLISQLVEREILIREKLFTKHQILKGDRFWWQPQNQTYYYRINREKLQELANSALSAETPETSVFCSTKILSDLVEQDTKFSDCPKNNTDNTSIKNNSTDKSLPTLPVESGLKEPLNQRKGLTKINIETVLTRPAKKQVNSTDSQVIKKETNSAAKDKIFKKNNLDKGITKPKPKVEKTKPGTKPKQKKKNLAPWQDQGEFKRFYRELLKYAKVFARNPHALTQYIITKLRRGESDPCWDDFKAGVPLGSSSQQEWEIKPGVPYPMFLEYLAEKLKGSHDGGEKAYEAALRILDEPKKAQVFWSQFKRSVINVSQQVENDLALGVSNPHTPVWTRERVEPSTEEAATAGAKIMEVNGTAQKSIEASNNPQLEAAGNTQIEDSLPPTPYPPHPEQSSIDPWMDEEEPQLTMRQMLTQKLGDRNLKGFVKQMPQVSQKEVEAEAAAEAEKEEGANRKSKVNISRMTMAEINESLQDPILRKELMPQLWYSDYALITDELGEIIKVERSPLEE